MDCYNCLHWKCIDYTSKSPLANGHCCNDLSPYYGQITDEVDNGCDVWYDDLNFWLGVGNRVAHVKDIDSIGTVVQIDDNLISTYGVTTCRVHWDDCTYDSLTDGDIQWTNKLVVVNR